MEHIIAVVVTIRVETNKGNAETILKPLTDRKGYVVETADEFELRVIETLTNMREVS